VIAAIGDEIARRGEVRRRLVLQARRLGGSRRDRLRRTIVDD
jgi:hypothetical protein